MTKSRIWFYSVVAALGGFLFGFDTIVINGAEKDIQAVWGLSGTMHGWVISSALWGTVLGSLFGGRISDRFGRKRTLLSVGVLFFVSAVWSGLASGPREWIPEVDEGSMLGDNQAGVYAAQRLVPGAAVVNIGTSGQLSVVADGLPRGDLGEVEERTYPGGKTLRCRASLVGGKALADLQTRIGLSWDELNGQAERNGEIASCIDGIVSDLAVGMDVAQVSELVGVGNALTRNPSVIRAVERRFGRTCRIPDVAEMAAYGAALFKMDRRTA